MGQKDGETLKERRKTSIKRCRGVRHRRGEYLEGRGELMWRGGAVGFAVCTLTGLLFISAYVQPPSNTYFDNTSTKKKKDLHSSPCRPRWIWVENRRSGGKRAADAEIMWMFRRKHF